MKGYATMKGSLFTRKGSVIFKMGQPYCIGASVRTACDIWDSLTAVESRENKAREVREAEFSERFPTYTTTAATVYRNGCRRIRCSHTLEAQDVTDALNNAIKAKRLRYEENQR